jgi:hypothetical protein
MKYYGYIYLVTDLLNKHNLPKPFYVGQSKGKFKPNYFGSGKYIKPVVRKHDRKNFKIKLISWAYSKEELNELEIAWIADIDCIWPKGYNLSEGGEGGIGIKSHKLNCTCPYCQIARGTYHPTSETKEKQRQAHFKHALNCQCISCLCERDGIHKDNCQCGSCKKKRGEPRKYIIKGGCSEHKDNCQCVICLNTRKQKHESNCKCIPCRYKRNELIVHRDDCQCASCESKRGIVHKSIHKNNCNCFCCRNKRGEPYKGKPRGKKKEVHDGKEAF